MHNYYHIISQLIEEQSATFIVALDSSCSVYEGHFPGNPIAPGACNIEMVRQCACIAMKHTIRFSAIRLCKFMMLLRPCEPEHLTIQMNWTAEQMSATILAEEKPAVQLKVNILCVEK